METLKVLMWKHFMVRKRRFIHTPVEIISPAILFIILFCFKIIILSNETYSDDYEQYNVTKPDPVELGSVLNNIDKIFYTPETEFSNRLMKCVEEYYELHKENARGYYGYRTPKIIPVNDTTMLQNLTSGILDHVIVLFKGIDPQTTTPNKLAYAMNVDFPDSAPNTYWIDICQINSCE